MYNNDTAGSLVGTSDVARYVTVTSCPLAMATNSLAKQQAAQAVSPNFFTTTDHAYEIHWLADFFDFLIDNTGARSNTLELHQLPEVLLREGQYRKLEPAQRRLEFAA